MAKSGKNVKNNVLPHSQAKLDLYKSYLDMYLPILGYSPFVTGINVFDIFCGTGIYEDGKPGSPLIAAACIQAYEAKVGTSKPVRFFINDYDPGKVSGVKSRLEQIQFSTCSIQDYNLDAFEMLQLVADNVNSFPKTERNLVFIDPYGYSQIHSECLYNILRNGKTEVILFLPAAHMKRFSEGALTDLDNKAYENLRRFILDFLPANSPIRNGIKLDVFDYIEELRNAFSFEGRFYTASHYIERDASNYFALFFIGSNIYGLEKFIEAKWKNASLGQGFNQKDRIPTLWGEAQAEVDHHVTLEHLEKLARALFAGGAAITNLELYEFTLRNQYKPSHMKELIRDWYKAKKIRIFDPQGNPVESTRSLALDYKDFKTNEVNFIFKK